MACGPAQPSRPDQPGRPAYVRLAATRFEDFGGRTRVPVSLTRPQQVGCRVFISKPVELDLNRSFNIFDDYIKHSRPNPERPRQALSISGLDPIGNMHIHSRKLNGSTSFTVYNIHYVNFRIQV